MQSSSGTKEGRTKASQGEGVLTLGEHCISLQEISYCLGPKEVVWLSEINMDMKVWQSTAQISALQPSPAV